MKKQPIVLNIRGTSGSGKSTIVKKIMQEYASSKPIRLEGRYSPIGYILKHKNPLENDLWVMGHYEKPCGGCDTVDSLDIVYAYLMKAVKLGMNVLYEGVMITYEVNRTMELVNAVGLNNFTCVALSKMCVEECLKAVNDRRYAKYLARIQPLVEKNKIALKNGEGVTLPEPYKPVAEKNTRDKIEVLRRATKRLRAENVLVVDCDRDEAYSFVANKLNA